MDETEIPVETVINAADGLSKVMDPSMWDFLTPEVVATFVLIALANIALLTTIKQALMRLKEGGVKTLDSPWLKATMELCQPVIGGAIGFHPDIFPDFPTAIGITLGIVAGFMSPKIYSYVLKKFMPNLMVSSEHRAEILAPVEPEGDASGENA